MAEPRIATAYRFDVAFSFAGPHRDKVREIAEKVDARVGRERVFFDEWFTTEILGRDMDVQLQRFYREQSLMVVADRSEEYAGREWCQAEARAIRDLLATLDTARDETARLRYLDVRLGSGALPPGSYEKIDGIYDGIARDTDECAEFILERLAILQKRLAAAAPPEAALDTPAAPPAPRPDFAETTEAVAAGLGALRLLQQKNAGIQTAVAAAGPTFAASRQQLHKLGDYKEIHDHLHRLNFTFVNPANEECGKCLESPAAINWSSLDVAEEHLTEAVEEIEKIATRPEVSPKDVAWVPKLLANTKAFSKVLEASDAAALPDVVRKIVRLVAIRPPNTINNILIETARKLSLLELDRCLQGLLLQMTAEERGAEDGKRFAHGAAALSQLRIGLRDLTEEHDRWQAVVSEMREINLQLQAGPGAFYTSWQMVRVPLLALCAKSAEAWATGLRQMAGDVDLAVAGFADDKIVKSFRSCFGRAATQFFAVDQELKTLCGELRRIAAALG